MAEYKQQQQPNPIQTMQLSGSINKIPTIEDLTMYENIDGSEEERCGNTPTEKVEWGYFIDLEAYNNIKNAFRNVSPRGCERDGAYISNQRRGRRVSR